MKWYDYQKRMARCLRAGKSVIVQAPTGGGKTLAALWPYLERWDAGDPAAFPRQCIYSAPARVLVNQFGYEVQKLVREEMLLRELPTITVQTGERPEDRAFMGDLIFTTIDQTLSSFLNVPYALSRGKANVNAGAVVASYLVFDEFHLFPHDGQGMGALPATIQMLRLLRRTTPFVLMTATFSQEMLAGLAELLDLDPAKQVIVVGDDDLDDINTHWGEHAARSRRLRLHRDERLSAAAVLRTHWARSLAVFNTVDRAIACFDDLLEAGCRPLPFDDPGLKPLYEEIEAAREAGRRQALVEQALETVRVRVQATAGWERTTWALLLHARFEPAHRAVKEELARLLFGPASERPWHLPSLILVATQVIEVGLNLTGEHLHTEIAPAASVLQRAGRCARFPGEQGTVHVYAVPPNKKGEPSYLPYPTALCEATWAALASWDEQEVDFSAEQKIVNQAHGPDDAALLARIRQEEGRLWAHIEEAVVRNDASTRRELIRQVDSRTVLVYEPPARLTEESPYRWRGFSLYHGSLRGKFEELETWAQTLGLEWALQYPVPREDPDDSRAPITYEWRVASSVEDIGMSLLFAVHPALAAYDALRGFRLVAPETGQGNRYRSPELPVRAGENRAPFIYQLESYADHIRTMIRLYEERLQNRLAYVGGRLAEHPEPELRLSPGALDRAVRLAIALHDAGKLQAQWQQWARNYTAAIGDPVPDFLIAHTRSETSEHREKEKEIRPRRPPHAGEGAVGGFLVIGTGLEGNRRAAQAVATAIARHHSPQAHRLKGGIRYDPDTVETIRAALEAAGLPAAWAERFRLSFSTPPNLEDYLLTAGDWLWWPLYFLVVRAVRLTDAESQES